MNADPSIYALSGLAARSVERTPIVEYPLAACGVIEADK